MQCVCACVCVHGVRACAVLCCAYVPVYIRLHIIYLYIYRYSREEPFTALNVDVRHHDNLYESLDAFVKGDLLEGANAYHCEKCDKKVGDTGILCFCLVCKIISASCAITE